MKITSFRYGDFESATPFSEPGRGSCNNSLKGPPPATSMSWKISHRKCYNQQRLTKLRILDNLHLKPTRINQEGPSQSEWKERERERERERGGKGAPSHRLLNLELINLDPKQLVLEIFVEGELVVGVDRPTLRNTATFTSHKLRQTDRQTHTHTQTQGQRIVRSQRYERKSYQSIVRRGWQTARVLSTTKKLSQDTMSVAQFSSHSHRDQPKYGHGPLEQKETNQLRKQRRRRVAIEIPDYRQSLVHSQVKETEVHKRGRKGVESGLQDKEAASVWWKFSLLTKDASKCSPG